MIDQSHKEHAVVSTIDRSPSLSEISVIIPVKNEEASIRQLLEGLATQSYQPAEIVITDGGSTDHTRDVIREHQATSAIPIVLIEVEEALPGRGRNLAIAKATHEWIASLDGGIRPRPDWLHQLVLTAKREPEAEVIYGVAVPVTDNYFTECAAISYVPNGRLTQFIASSLLLRSAWERAGGFREDLRASEDLLFFKSLDAAGVKTTKCENAVVTWELRPSLASTFQRFRVYSRNGMRAGLAHEWQNNVTRLYLVMLTFWLFALLAWPLLFVPPAVLVLRAEKRIWGWYRALAPQRVWREMLNPRRILTVAFINVVIDIATFCGMWDWFIHDRRKQSTPRNQR